MDEAVMRGRSGMRASSAGTALLALLALAAFRPTQAQAQALPDPTRPPAFLQRGGSAPDSSLPATPALPRLQSILIARHAGGRHVAVIDGHTLRPGDKYQGAVLTSVTDSEVVLQSGKKRQVLRLFPATPTR